MYKKLLLLFLLFSTPVYANLIVNEVMYYPSDGNEWIEIYNNASFSIDIALYNFSDSQSTDAIKTCPSFLGTTIINPNEYALLTDKDTSLYNTTSFNGTKVCVDDNSIGNGLSNSGDTISIFNSTFNISLDYSLITSTGSGYSLELVDFSNEWKKSLIINGTPGYKNSNVFLNVTTENILKITEFLADPQGYDTAAMPDGEWIELYNEGNDNIDLLGFILKDKNDNNELIITSTNVENSTTIIKTREYKVIYRNENGKFNLNNDEFEKIRLYNSNLTLLDEVSYSTTREAVSWSKIKDIWILTVPTPAKENEQSEIEDSYIKINKIQDLGSDKKAKFGQNIRVDVEIYKGDTTKNNVKFFIENNVKERISKVTDINVYSKFLTYDLTIPLQINPNCKNEFNETDYTIQAEGLNATVSTAIKIEGITKSLCEKIKVSLKETEEVTYEILDYPEEIIFGNTSTIKLKITNKDTDEKSLEAWSYIYKGNKAVSGDREANKKLIKIPSESSIISELTNELVEEISGDYKLKIKIKEEERKTPEEFTLDVTVKTLAKNSEKEEIIPANNKIKETENMITGNTIYQDSNIKTKRSAIFFFTGTLICLLLLIAIKRPL
ncbi:lamin tail domain-containing protein [Candidatus Woesearchaeota archaeon]|nr:lamin tail domain-containing protein [Candidatus Woesearchaeota archaeon]